MDTKNSNNYNKRLIIQIMRMRFGGASGEHWRDEKCTRDLVGEPEGKRKFGERRFILDDYSSMDVK
jgi:hypothetical protein